MTADHPSAKWAEAVAARLCHDLAGLAGTVAALLELADEDATQAKDAIPVARDAADRLRHRLLVARAAFGGSDSWTEGSLPELLASLANKDLRVDLDPRAAMRCRDAATGRLLLNVTMLGSELLRARGDIRVRTVPAGSLSVALTPAPGRAAPAWPSLSVADLGEPLAFQQGWTALVAASCGARLHSAGPILRVEMAT